MWDLRQFAEKKHRESGHPLADWLRVLESARINLRFLNVSTDTLERMAQHCDSPSQFTVLLRLLYQFGRSFPRGERVWEMLEERADGSAYPLKQWVAALEVLHQWTEAQGAKVSLKDLMDYLSCCTELPDAQLGQSTLPSLVKNALEIYGMDKAKVPKA